MHIRSLAFLLFTLTVTVFLFSSCDSQVAETKPETEIKMTHAPITYVGNTAKTSPKTLSEIKNTAPYYCIVSTLNPEDKDWAYNIQRFDIAIPTGLVKQAKKQGKDKKWVTYQFADQYALARTNADTLGGGGLVRMARCRLPATGEVLNAVERQLTNFDKSSWINERKTKTQKQKTTSDVPSPDPVQSGWEYRCTAVVDRFICDEPGVANPFLNSGCTYIETKCVEYNYVYVPEDEGPPSGGGGGSSDDGDPCTACASDPGGPAVPCKNQPGGDIGIPQGCAVEGDIEIVEPCDTEETAIDSLSKKPEMQEFWEESYGTDLTPLPENQRNEKLGFIIKNGDNYSIQNISATDVSSCHISPGSITKPSNAVGLLHTHPYSDGDKLKDQRCLDHIDYNLEENDGKYPTYNASNESPADRNVVTNSDLPMYIMDKDDIHVLKPSNPYQYMKNINRCGY